MKASTEMKIRNNYVVRFIGLPFVRALKYVQYIDYHKRVDTEYIKSIKNTMVGKRCFIIGNGPSLTPEDLDMIKGEFSFGCNRIFDIYEKTSWRPNYYVVYDKNVINSLLKQPVIELEVNKAFVSDKRLANYWSEKNDVQEIFNKGRTTIAKEKYYIQTVSENIDDYFTSSQTVATLMFEIAFYMGFTEIYLLGIDNNYGIEKDMNGNKIINNIQSHFYETKDADGNRYTANIEAATKCYETCKKYADSHGVKVYNCTRGGKLEVFERKNLEDVINEK
jgi:hypothetical protein